MRHQGPNPILAILLAVLVSVAWGCLGSTVAPPLPKPEEKPKTVITPAKPVPAERIEADKLRADASKAEAAAKDADRRADKAEAKATLAEFKADHAGLFMLLEWIEWIGVVMAVGGLVIMVILKAYSVPFLSYKLAGAISGGGVLATSGALLFGEALPHLVLYAFVVGSLALLGWLIYELYIRGKAHLTTAISYDAMGRALATTAPGVKEDLDRAARSLQETAGRGVKLLNDHVLNHVPGRPKI